MRLARYPDAADAGLDGVSYHFYVQHDYFGETWSPRVVLPKQLVELADLLYKATKCTPDERMKILAEFGAKTRGLQRTAASQVKPNATSP